jgi:hypothetical protein
VYNTTSILLAPSNSYTTTKQQQCCMHVNTVVILLPPPPPSPNSPLMFTVTLQASLFSTSTAGTQSWLEEGALDCLADSFGTGMGKRLCGKKSCDR